MCRKATLASVSKSPWIRNDHERTTPFLGAGAGRPPGPQDNLKPGLTVILPLTEVDDELGPTNLLPGASTRAPETSETRIEQGPVYRYTGSCIYGLFKTTICHCLSCLATSRMNFHRFSMSPSGLSMRLASFRGFLGRELRSLVRFTPLAVVTQINFGAHVVVLLCVSPGIHQRYSWTTPNHFRFKTS